MRIAFASGKGGTGKTMMATSVARVAGPGAAYVDADVEEPNGHLFLHPTVERETRFAVDLPEPVPDRCDGCRLCQQHCAFHAILVAGTRVLVFPELCHSCDVCVDVCPRDALAVGKMETGTVRLGDADGIFVVEGRLDVGQARATPLIGHVTRAAPPDADPVLIDCPPGTSCAAVSSVEGADLVVLVTEPTPFGLHDLELAAEMCRELGKPVAAVINRADLGDEAVRNWLAERGIPLLAEIPFDRGIAETYAAGGVVADRSVAVRRAAEAVLAHARRELS